MDIFVKDGGVMELTKEESNHIQKKGKHVRDLTKNMTPEELEAFKKERYQKFIKPLMEHNRKELEGLGRKGSRSEEELKRNWSRLV